jgi:hypothetical protein
LYSTRVFWLRSIGNCGVELVYSERKRVGCDKGMLERVAFVAIREGPVAGERASLRRWPAVTGEHGVYLVTTCTHGVTSGG